jgi:beta-aspartyl-peptidase (threonine type)
MSGITPKTDASSNTPLPSPSHPQSDGSYQRWKIVLHGGAGKVNLKPERELLFRKALNEAVLLGADILNNGGTSLDAVVKVVQYMEDNPLFNAGKGAIYNEDGVVELDASIMDGKTIKGAGVGALKHVKNPIALARAVMDIGVSEDGQPSPVLIVGEGAERFAGENNIEIVRQDYFYVDARHQLYLDARKKKLENEALPPREMRGTVGCVALDNAGNLAAGTSTGGYNFKPTDRIGDSGVIGAGTYADNNTCAISATGAGEYFIRGSYASRVSILMESGLPLQQSMRTALKFVADLGAREKGDAGGGAIGIDKKGNIATEVFNTDAMMRAYIDASGHPQVKIFTDAEEQKTLNATASQ